MLRPQAWPERTDLVGPDEEPDVPSVGLPQESGRFALLHVAGLQGVKDLLGW